MSKTHNLTHQAIACAAALFTRCYRLALPGFIAVLALAATPAALGQGAGGNHYWTGAADTDFYNDTNWNTGSWPNGNAWFGPLGGSNTTVDRSSFAYNYLYGLYFNNTTDANGNYTISGSQAFFFDNNVATSAMTSGYLNEVVNNNITRNPNNGYNIALNHDLTLNGVISSNTALVKKDAGTLTLNGQNTYTGNTTVTGGILSLTTGQIYSNNGWANRTITINGGGLVEVGGWADGDTTNSKAGLGQVAFNASNIVVDNGTIRYTGSSTTNNSDRGFTIGAGGATLEAEGGNDFVLTQGRGFGVVSSAGGTLTLSGSQNGTFNHQLGGSGGLVKDGAGTWTVNNSNTYSGNVLVSGGTLATGASGGGRLGANTAGRTVTADGATSVLDVASTNAIVPNHSTENNITLVAQNGGIIRNSSGALNRIGDVTLDGGTLEANVDNVNWGSWYFGTRNGGQDSTVTVSGSAASTISGAGNIALGANTQFNVADVTGGADLTVSAILATGSSSGHAGGFTKTGAGTMVLSANNTFSGGTTVNGGTIILTDAGRIGGGGLTVNNGGTFSITNDDFNSLGGAITVNEGGILSTDSTGNNAHNIAGITLNGGTLTSSGNAYFEGNWIFNNNVTVGGTALSTISGLAIGSKSGGGTYNVADSVAGSGTDLLVTAQMVDASGGSFLTKTGAGTMELTAANTYSGATTVSEGTLSLAGGYTHSGSGAYVIQGGTLKIADGVDISGHAMTISLGGVISPGNSPGTAIVGNQTWGDGGSYLWEINDTTGWPDGAGKGSDPGWDWLDIQGTLDISATFTIQITSLDLANNSGLANGFDYTGLSYLDPYASFTIATATGAITGFDPSAFDLDDSAFLNPKVGWSIENIGGDIILNAFFVPEPSSSALLGLGSLILAFRRKRS